MPELSIGPIEAIVLIVGITQFIKEVFTLGGRGAKILTFAVAFGISAVAFAYGEGMIGESIKPYVELVAVALGGAISAMGDYDLIFRERGSTDKLYRRHR